MKQTPTSILVCVMAVWMTACSAKAQPLRGGKHQTNVPFPGLVELPAGQFERGDHHGFADPKHGSDEVPVRPIRVDTFAVGIHDVTTKEYCDFLNAALAEKRIEVRDGGVFLTGQKELLCETRGMSEFSRIGWDGIAFAVLDQKEKHPMVCVRWEGAAAYCNWLSGQKGLPQCYNTSTWDCDFNKSGFRLPTEAEWEYAGRGGQYDPYWNYPWANEADPSRANWPESKNPYRAGPLPWTTPVGFFDGKLHRKADLKWPGPQETFQTSDGANGFGLYDMSGNVWQWCTEWYERNYYAYCPDTNPPGPAEGSPMPDGKPYRCMRGGNWFNGENGHGRVSNRDPSYFRGPQDPNHPFNHIGFRVVLPIDAEKRPAIKPTPVQRVARPEGKPGGKQSKDGPHDGGQKPERKPEGGSRDRGQKPERKPEGEPLKPVQKPGTSLVLRSPAVGENGVLPKEFTGDGASISPPLEWSKAPAGTKSFAVIMHHVAPDMTKWYWVLYNIPAETTSLPKDVQGVGKPGTNSMSRKLGYAPPHSKGPGTKQYTLTLYALSAAPKISVAPEEVSRDVLIEAMKGLILDSAELNVTYTREVSGDDREPLPRPGEKGQKPKPKRSRDQ